jgi:hypothetical protein
MTPVRLSARDVQSMVRASATPVRSGESVRSSPAPTVAARRARGGGSIVAVTPYLAVLIAVIAGVYLAWDQGSVGGGEGGVVSGVALLAAAFVRLVLPARLTGLLGTRKRMIDVLTLVIFGGGLLVVGLVLPR